MHLHGRTCCIWQVFISILANIYSDIFSFLNRRLYYSWIINWIEHLEFAPDLSILRQFIGYNKNSTTSSGSYLARPPRGTVWLARFCSPLWPLLSSPPQQMANGPKVSKKRSWQSYPGRVPAYPEVFSYFSLKKLSLLYMFVKPTRGG